MRDLLEDQLCAQLVTRCAPLSLHIGIEYGVGGVGRILSELMRCLPDAGFNFTGLVTGPAQVSFQTAGLVNRFSEGESLRARLSGARQTIGAALRVMKPAIVASHFALYTAPALDLLRGCANVTHFHGPWAGESRQEGERSLTTSVKSLVEGRVYRRADRVIVLSHAFASLAQKDFGVAEEKLRLVPGCVDVDRFAIDETRRESRELLGLPCDRPILVSVRRLVRRMGLHTLIEALATVRQQVPDLLLCIGGRGPMSQELMAIVEQHGLGDNVRFLGFIEEEKLPYLYRAADLNIVPSEALEGFGLVAAEAIAAGTPSMVTPVGGLPEVVSELSPNLVFRSCAANDLAEGITQALLGRIALPDEDACRSYIRNNFTARRMAEQTAAVYRELL
jgi:glycosyltransferase involved in cell wall biosynthesis